MFFLNWHLLIKFTTLMGVCLLFRHILASTRQPFTSIIKKWLQVRKTVNSHFIWWNSVRNLQVRESIMEMGHFLRVHLISFCTLQVFARQCVLHMHDERWSTKNSRNEESFNVAFPFTVRTICCHGDMAPSTCYAIANRYCMRSWLRAHWYVHCLISNKFRWWLELLRALV